MRYYDVFNGDADGICALHQLRLADPLDSVLVTGYKRDIALLRALEAGDGDVVTVLDISLDRNRDALEVLLARGAVVHYFDHHYAGNIPRHSALLAVIQDSPGTSTSALVDRYLRGRFRPWAVVGTFGDNLDDAAAALAKELPDIDETGLSRLRELGVALNYAAYGQRPADVLIAPADLYRVVSHYADPFELIAKEPIIERLRDQRAADLDLALATRQLYSTPACDAWVLPDQPWARRVIGTFADRLALQQPHRAHAVLAPRGDATMVVSVRSPRGRAPRAADFCRRYPNGGGRAEAGGIDHLKAWEIDPFFEELHQAWSAHPLPLI